MAAGKSKRKPKTSRGEHGGGGQVRLTEVQKVLLGKGILDSYVPPQVPHAR